MKTQQRHWVPGRGWNREEAWSLRTSAQLVLVFGSRELLASDGPMAEVVAAHPSAQIVGCTTAGEICGTRVTDDSLVVNAISFDRTKLRAVRTNLSDGPDSQAAGRRLAHQLAAGDLAHVLVFSEGLKVNGSDLARGLSSELPSTVAVTGGLSGDGSRFQRTQVYLNGHANDGDIVAVGLYGDHLRVGYGSLGGWDPFGPERIVTRSQGNVLYELDGESALALYKQYLGPHAAGLPASGLRFPLTLWAKPDDTPVVRTILAISEKDQSMTFAGDVPQGMRARLMRTNFDRLVDGATGAARASQAPLGSDPAELAILISCVGRKLVLQQRIEEELEGVRGVLGSHPAMTGFYSYGEIAPFHPGLRCELHNQTMTVTVLSEAA